MPFYQAWSLCVSTPERCWTQGHFTEPHACQQQPELPPHPPLTPTNMPQPYPGGTGLGVRGEGNSCGPFSPWPLMELPTGGLRRAHLGGFCDVKTMLQPTGLIPWNWIVIGKQAETEGSLAAQVSHL